jgi:hypothetical protein
VGTRAGLDGVERRIYCLCRDASPGLQAPNPIVITSTQMFSDSWGEHSATSGFTVHC